MARGYRAIVELDGKEGALLTADRPFTSGRTTSTHWRGGVHVLSATRRVSTDSVS